MAIHKKGLAHWEGDLKHGKGTVSTESGALSQQPYGFNTRFEGVKGTNPEGADRRCTCRLLFDGPVADAQRRGIYRNVH